MKCNTLICSQNVIIDKNTNQTSIINIYEGVQSAFFPFQIPMAIFISTEKEIEEEQPITINLKMELEGQILLNAPISIAFVSPASLKNNTTVNLQGIIIAAPGRLIFSVIHNEVELKKGYIVVEQKAQ